MKMIITECPVSSSSFRRDLDKDQVAQVGVDLESVLLDGIWFPIRDTAAEQVSFPPIIVIHDKEES